MSHGRSSGHLSDVLLQSRDSGSVDFFGDDISFGGDGSLRSGREGDWRSEASTSVSNRRGESLTILVEWSVIDHFSTILDESLSKLLGQSVGRSSIRIASVDVVLHVVELQRNKSDSNRRRRRPSTHELRISSVHDDDTSSSDVSIDSSEATESEERISQTRRNETRRERTRCRSTCS